MSGSRLPLLEPELTAREATYLSECVMNGYVSSVGPLVPRFEETIAEILRVNHAVACVSGTAALHLSLAALDLPATSEVFVSDLTFIATANAASYLGLRPVLVDSEPQSWNMDPSAVADELARRSARGERMPGAIIPVHTLGYPADMGRILAVAEPHGIPVIEDAAGAIGAEWHTGPLSGQMAGTAGLAGCFSFNGNKLITTGGGGLVVSADAAFATRVRHLSTQARASQDEYDHDMIGYNYRLTNIAAAVGLAQLERFDSLINRRRAVAERYDEAFAGLPRISLPPRGPHKRSGWLYAVLLDDHETRDRVRLSLTQAEIDARPIWRPLHLQRPHADARRIGSGAIAEDLWHRALALPSSSTLVQASQDRVSEIVVSCILAA
jgi:dTDP-4-amino-4,6-dideoxygalactose transaminase